MQTGQRAYSSIERKQRTKLHQRQNSGPISKKRLHAMRLRGELP